MPVRPVELVARIGAYGKTFYLTEQEWTDLDNLIVVIDKWNKEVCTFVEELSEELSEKFGEQIKVNKRTFNSLYEDIGFEKFEPRNYLAYEVLEVSSLSQKSKYLFGKHPDLSELREIIIEDLYVKNRKEAEPTGDGKSSGNLIVGDGGEPRKSRLERYAEKICESVDVLQSAKRRARSNPIQNR